MRVRGKSYDVATHYGNRQHRGQQQQDMPQACFDFVLWWDDGTCVRLHPEWSSTQVRCYAEQPHADQVQPTARDVGQSAGPGYFRRTLDQDVSRKLRFDAAKNRPFKRLGK